MDAGAGDCRRPRGARAQRNTVCRDRADGALHLHGLRGERDQVRSLLLADRYQVLSGNRFPSAGACLRRAGPGRHGDPDLALRPVFAFGPPSAADKIGAGTGVAGGAVRSLELFAPLTDDETHALAAQLIGTPFGPGDIATRQGEPSDSLYILARGQVAIFRDAAPGSSPARQRLATLAAPAIFGEMGLLTGQARTATITAESEVLCYRLDKAAFEAIIQARPELADALAQTVATRQAANDATLASLSAEARARATGTRAGELLRKIRQFFGLESGDGSSGGLAAA